MRVLEQHQHRPLGGEAGQLLEPDLLQLGLAPLGAELKGIEVVLDRDPQQGRSQGRRLLHRSAATFGEQQLELGELVVRRVVAAQAGGVLDLLEDRMEGRVLMEGRAEIAQPRVWLTGDPLTQVLQQARFADAWFAGDQDGLPLRRFGPAASGPEVLPVPAHGRPGVPR